MTNDAKPIPSRAELLIRAAEVLEQEPNKMWQSLPRLEYLPEAKVRAMLTPGTALEPLVYVLMRYAEVGNTVGGVMDSPVKLSKQEIHDTFCSCFFGKDAKASIVAASLRELAAK